MKSLARKIKDANREVYNNMSPEKYNMNESIFNDARRSACVAVLKTAAERSGKGRYLDVATGSGNLLRIGEGIFDECYAVDIGENMLRAIKEEFPRTCLVAADAEYLPFQNDSFNCVSCYAMLHHLLTHEKLFQECFRVLRDGGTLYTDHDPNYFLNRFYHIVYRLRYRNKPGFGSDLAELAEYHNSQSPGINPVKLKKLLLETGFKKIVISYRVTDKEHWSGMMSLIIPCLRGVSKIIPLKSFFTHFSITAIK
ncbi:MAG: class I SAM-dependent methyltransferase [Kiritimatiellaeota bacterium]|nr:class I SAM-dependent methyltransferase [Kiritimatiellota bacterium]